MSISAYIESKKLAWSPATITSEEARLKANARFLNMAPELAYAELSNKYKPYTIKTMFIRFNEYLKFERNDNSYAQFLKTNARLFKSAYKRKTVKLNHEEAMQKINTITDQTVKNHALFLLRSGLRISESYGAGAQVTGKGNKTRTVFVERPQVLADQWKLRRALAKLGLTPHDLRKLCATRLVDKGLAPQDLCKVMGWSSIETAFNYLQPKKDDELRELMK